MYACMYIFGSNKRQGKEVASPTSKGNNWSIKTVDKEYIDIYIFARNVCCCCCY